jgi:hypothetical protein
MDSQLALRRPLREGVMGTDQHSRATRLCLARQFTERRMGDLIEGTEGFVEHQEFDGPQERLGDDELLAVPF